MTQQGSQIINWGYNLEEYQAMFSLTEEELDRSILDYGAGFSSFNAELSARGGSCVSCDPLYSLNEKQIAEKSHILLQSELKKIKQQQNQFVWDRYGSFETFTSNQIATMGTFLQDFSQGIKVGRYTTDGLPSLSFKDFQFELLLASHALFSPAQNQLDYYLNALVELTRVALEVRIFPLFTDTAAVKEILGPLMVQLQLQNYGMEIRKVPYEFEAGKNAMLRVWRLECKI